MNCRDFQRKWDELLDADARASAVGAESLAVGPFARPPGEAGEEALVDHASGCPDCRQLAVRYQVLRQATRAWRRPPLPSAGLADRILSAAEESTPSAWAVYGNPPSREWPVAGWAVWVVAAAVFLAAVVLPMINRQIARDRPQANPPMIAAEAFDHDLHAVSVPDPATDGRPPLDRAFADATSATWDLARSASAPAARISREFLDATNEAEDVSSDSRSETRPIGGDRDGMTTVGLSVPVPSLAPLAPDASAASAALQQVGDHLAAGVRPLSDTARHAFGFLIGPSRDRAAPRNSPPTAKGA